MIDNTKDFFDKVRTGNIAQIDIEEYIEVKTRNHDGNKLKTLLKDLEFYLFVEKDYKIGEITQTDWEEKHKYYKDKGEEIPLIRREYLLKKLKKENGLNVADEPDFIYYYDEEALFFPFEFFALYQLKSYLKKLIKKQEVIFENMKHENIFSNNGFMLFKHILTEYVKPKDIRGRKSEIAFFYWKLYNNNPQFIHQKPQQFKDWYFENYDGEDLGKIKTLNEVADSNRNKHFSNALDWFKRQIK